MGVLIVLLLICFSYPYESSGSEGGEFCVTTECLNSALAIVDSLDTNVDPCHDFYRFACGNIINNTEIPEDQADVGTVFVIRDNIIGQLRTILEKPIDKDEIKPIILLKKYFQSCMHEELIDQQSSKYLLDLYETLGGWPVLKEDSWNEEKFDWTKLMYDFRRLGFNINTLLELTIAPDPLNSTVHIVKLDQAVFNLLLSREDLITNSYIESYFNLMVDVAEQFGANRSRAEQELQESLEFEIKLANISLSTEERRNISKLVTRMTINEFQGKYPKTPWLELINKFLLLDVPLTDNDLILVAVPSYFAAFEKLIGETPKRVQANYGLWTATLQVIKLLPKDVFQHYFNTILKPIFGQEKPLVRWKECMNTALKDLPLLVSSLYIRQYFDKDAKKVTLEMVGYLKNTFKDMLKNLDWMDEGTRQRALEKAEKMTEVIGYPNELLNNALLEKLYDTLETYADQYLKSYLNIQAFKTNLEYNKLRKPVIKADWTTFGNVVTIRAAYKPLDNSLFFPVGMLQGAYFHKHRPRYINYGTMGTIIGREITHGFDDKGRQLDGNGILRNWWSPKTAQSFFNKTQCIIYQYGNYTVPEINVNINGVQTQGENIADNGGLKNAYLAYNSWVKKNKEEQRLPGLEEYSPRQLFWVSAAMNMCVKAKPEIWRIFVAQGIYSPHEFRVLGPFSNSKEFANDFRCSSGSRMNPVNKCGVW